MNFIGTYANLSGLKVGRFAIEQLAGRASGAPVWRVVCDNCHYPQTLPHARLAPLVQGKGSQNTLRCANAACPLSRQVNDFETLSELRRRERKEAEQAARADAESQAAADAEAAKQRVEDARIAALKSAYRFYFNHQIKTVIDQHKIVSFSRWQQLSDGTRKIVLDALRADPTVRVEGL